MAKRGFHRNARGWWPNFQRKVAITGRRGRKSRTESLESRLLLAATLDLQLSETSVSEGAGEDAIMATVTRLDPPSLTTALTVLIGVDHADEISFPATVTIPANQASTTFQIDTINDAIVDGTASVALTATAVSFSPGTGTLSVTDDDTATQKIIGGQLNGTLATDTYTVSHSIVVPAAQQMTLSGGTEIRFSTGQRMEVLGQLLAEGDIDNPIHFTSASATPATGDWNGVVFRNDSSQERSFLDHTAVEYAVIGVSLFGQNGPVTISNSVIRLNSASGVRVIDDNSSAALIVTANRIHDNAGDGVYISASGSGCNSGSTSITLTENEVDHNGMAAVRLTASGSSSCIIGPGAGFNSSIVSDNRIHDNLDGIAAHASHGGRRGGVLTPTIQNNFIYDNLNDGISITSNSSSNRLEPSIVNNTVVRNGRSGFSHDPSTDAGMRFFNNLIAGNLTGVRTDPAFVLLDGTVGHNSVSDNPGGDWVNYPSAVGDSTTTNVNGTPADAWFNISVPPSFKTDNLHIRASSGLVDAGTDSAGVSGPTLDIDGQTRDTPPDIGADEVPRTELSVTVTPTLLPENGGSAAAVMTIARRTSTAQALTVSLTSSDHSELTVPPAAVIPAGRTSVTVDLTVVDDNIVDGTQFVTVTAMAAGHDNGSDSLTVTDDDVPTLTVSIAATSIREDAGNAATTITVSRNTATDEELTVNLASDDTTAATVQPIAVIPFGQTSVTIEIAAVDDMDIDGTQTATLIANAIGYLTGMAVLSVVDDESHLTVDIEADAILESAGVSATTLTVTRNSATTTELLVTLTISDATEARIPVGGTNSPSSAVVAIPAGQSSVVVPVRAIDESLVDGDQIVTIAATADGHQTGTDAVIVLDDDAADFDVVESGDVTTVDEDGDITDTFTVVLRGQPINDVVIKVDVDDDSLITGTPTSLTFRSVTWNVPQTVTVSGIPDDKVDGLQTAVVRLSVDTRASDPVFASAPAQDVTTTVTDNDTAGFTLSKTNAAVTESGSADSFSVVLPAEPLSDVVLNVSSHDENEVVAAPARLTFTPANWNTPQTVMLSGVDDPIVDANSMTLVTLSVDAAESDDAFDDLPDQAVVAVNGDNDVAQFTVSATSVSVDESGTAENVTIVLNAAPVTEVVLALNSNDESEVAVAPSRIIFTAANWNVSQIITLTGVDDQEIDGLQTSEVIISVDSAASDEAWASLPAQTVTATTADDDAASQSGNVDGDGDFDANDSFLIHLIKLSGTDTQINQSKGSSALTASEIRTTVTALDVVADVDGDGDFDANDSFLIHLIKLSGTDTQINQSKGSSALTATDIRARVERLNPPLQTASRLASSVAVNTMPYPTEPTAIDKLFASSDVMRRQIASPRGETSVFSACSEPVFAFRNWIDSI